MADTKGTKDIAGMAGSAFMRSAFPGVMEGVDKLRAAREERKKEQRTTRDTNRFNRSFLNSQKEIKDGMLKLHNAQLQTNSILGKSLKVQEAQLKALNDLKKNDGGPLGGLGGILSSSLLKSLGLGAAGIGAAGAAKKVFSGNKQKPKFSVGGAAAKIFSPKKLLFKAIPLVGWGLLAKDLFDIYNEYNADDTSKATGDSVTPGQEKANKYFDKLFGNNKSVSSKDNSLKTSKELEKYTFKTKNLVFDAEKIEFKGPVVVGSGGGTGGGSTNQKTGSAVEKAFTPGGTTNMKVGGVTGGGGVTRSVTGGGSTFSYTGLGSISKKYESGRGGVGTISSGRGDKGGVSYGAHQLASNTGTMAKYLASSYGSKYAANFAGLTPGTPAFNDAYRRVVASDPKGFAASQKAFITATHYDPVAKHAAKLGWNVDDPRVQEALYSMGVQHGGAKKIVSRAGSPQGKSVEEQIKMLYGARTKYVSGLDIPNKEALYNRYAREQRDVLGMSSSPALKAIKDATGGGGDISSLRVKAGGKTRTLGSMGISSYAQTQAGMGGQAFAGGFNDPNVTFAALQIQKGLGENFNRITAQNDLYHKTRRKAGTSHRTGRKLDFTLQGMSYRAGDTATRRILEGMGLQYGRDFKIISTPHGTAPHIDLGFTNSGVKKLAEYRQGLKKGEVSDKPLTAGPGVAAGTGVPAAANMGTAEPEIRPLTIKKKFKSSSPVSSSKSNIRRARGDYQSNGSRVINPDGTINWGDPDVPSDFFRASQALQAGYGKPYPTVSGSGVSKSGVSGGGKKGGGKSKFYQPDFYQYQPEGAPIPPARPNFESIDRVKANTSADKLKQKLVKDETYRTMLPRAGLPAAISSDLRTYDYYYGGKKSLGLYGGQPKPPYSYEPNWKKPITKSNPMYDANYWGYNNWSGSFGTQPPWGDNLRKRTEYGLRASSLYGGGNAYGMYDGSNYTMSLDRTGPATNQLYLDEQARKRQVEQQRNEAIVQRAMGRMGNEAQNRLDPMGENYSGFYPDYKETTETKAIDKEVENIFKAWAKDPQGMAF